jgi:hypothetical protein
MRFMALPLCKRESSGQFYCRRLVTSSRPHKAAGSGVSWISEPTVQVPFMQPPTLVPRYLSEAKEEQSCEKS